MTKNITVTDENGNKVGSTYPKRALGLVKKDRARWINADTICLCARDMEETTMANNFYEIFDNQITKMQEQIRDDNSETAMPVRMQILRTMETFRAQEQGTKILEMIKDHLDFLKSDLAKTYNIDFSNPANGMAFVSREETKQKMLSLMEKLINATMSTPPKTSDIIPSVVDEFRDNLQKQQPDNPKDTEKNSKEFSDKLNDEINSAFNKTE